MTRADPGFGPSLGDADIHAFGTPPAPAAPRPRRRWLRWLLLMTLLGFVLMLGLASWLWSHGDAGWQGNLALNGDPWLGWHGTDWDDLGWHGFEWHGDFGFGDLLGLLFAIGTGLLVAALVVPLVLLVMLGAGLAVGLTVVLAVLATLASLALALAAVLAVPLLLTAPLWGLVLLLWWLLRRKPAVASPGTAT